MHNTSTPLLRVPKSCAKLCVQLAETMWGYLVQNNTLFPHPFLDIRAVGITKRFLRISYTKYTQVIRMHVYKFTSVISYFSALYTPPITTTTTYINN